MRIRQHCSIGFTSTSVTADDMTARLGLEPDRILVRGSRRAEPPRPVFHIWEVRCEESSLRVDDQVERLVDRLESYAEAIGALAEELERDGGGSYLSVVRHFDDEHGEEEELSQPDEPLRKLAGQHQLLGWHLGRRVLDFLAVTRAEIDVDEYG